MIFQESWKLTLVAFPQGSPSTLTLKASEDGDKRVDDGYRIDSLDSGQGIASESEPST